MTTWIHALILGIIEGITEFLPVSSTGHLLLAQKLQWAPEQSELFNVVIQSGAVIAVLPLFPERLRQLFRIFREKAARDYIMKVALAFFITGVGGLLMKKFGYELQAATKPIAIALFVGGVAFLVVERWLVNRKTSDVVSWTAAVVVGLAQLIAMAFPGSSRSGSCIIFLLILGLSRPIATEFSFLVGVPTMLAAGAHEIFRELYPHLLSHTPGTHRGGLSGVFKALCHPELDAGSENWKMLALCTLISAVVSFLVVRWLLLYVQTHSFAGFGYYRILLGALVIAMLVTKTIPA